MKVCKALVAKSKKNIENTREFILWDTTLYCLVHTFSWTKYRSAPILDITKTDENIHFGFTSISKRSPLEV